MAAQIYRIKITLERIAPPIWRRIEVPAEVTLAELHNFIQGAMGWEDCHMWSFEVEKINYEIETGIFDFGGGPKTRSAGDATLAQATQGRRITFRYWYDFGDDWFHALKVERVREPEPGVIYPRCLDGARACPPEDCGGPWGYRNLLDALSDPKHPEHEDMVGWLGEDWDAEAFDLEAVNRAIQPQPSKSAKAAKRR